MSISINKTEGQSSFNNDHHESNVTNEMSERMDGICRELLNQNNEFKKGEQ